MLPPARPSLRGARRGERANDARSPRRPVASRPAPLCRETINWSGSIPFFLMHLAALGVFAVGFSWKGVLLCVASYYLRMFGVAAGLHRYFAHRSFKTSRAFQLVLALLGISSAQKGA